jgi:hypothetical protein
MLDAGVNYEAFKKNPAVKLNYNVNSAGFKALV